MSHVNTVLVTHENGGRAKPGLRFLLVLLLAALVLVAAGIYRFDQPRAVTPAAKYTYGALPSWLPKSFTPINKALQASAQRPQLAIEGDVVNVTMGPGVSTTATMVGPQTPPFTAPPPPLTTATLTISLRNTSGVVTLRAHDFALIDGNGVIYHPATFLGGQRSVLVNSRAATSVRIRQYMAVGSGSIMWAPAAHPVVTWEFTVEND